MGTATVGKVIDIITTEWFSEKDICTSFEDNVGLLVGSREAPVNSILCVLDVTLDTLDEAIACGVSLIICHHPIIFSKVSRINDDATQGKIIMRAIKSGISIYCAHTNLDYCEGGINDYVAKLVGLNNPQPLVVQANGVRIGRYAEIEPTSLSSYAEQISLKFGVVRVYGDNITASRVVVINGAGASDDLVALAKTRGINCYISSEFKHHVMLELKASGIGMIEIGHYEMEQIYMKTFAEILQEKLFKISCKVYSSQVERSPCINI